MTDVKAIESYALYCNEASVAVYLYGALCLQPQGYGDRIDKSERGYLLWLYAGTRSLDNEMLKVLNVALEEKNISIRVRKETIIEAPALGRRAFVGNRFVLRLERPGLTDLIGDDAESDAWAVAAELHSSVERLTAMARYMPRLALRHMSYVDVDTRYDVGFKPMLMAKGLRPEYSCHVLQNSKVIVSFTHTTP